MISGVYKAVHFMIGYGIKCNYYVLQVFVFLILNLTQSVPFQNYCFYLFFAAKYSKKVFNKIKKNIFKIFTYISMKNLSINFV